MPKSAFNVFLKEVFNVETNSKRFRVSLREFVMGLKIALMPLLLEMFTKLTVSINQRVPFVIDWEDVKYQALGLFVAYVGTQFFANKKEEQLEQNK